ncbi:MAG: DUF1365 family protein [Bacteroidia bacterium]|jgi:DUF1365 family protein
MNSAIYAGHVSHRRGGDKPHAFRNRLYMYMLDLDELDQVFRGVRSHSVERWNLVSYFRRDFLGDPATPLIEAVRDRVESQLGRRPLGAVRLLSQLRTLGYVFNPVSFYLCYDEQGKLDAIVAEITNTPWRERHAYVLDAGGQDELLFRFDKEFHVSPFFGMDHIYEWRFRVADEQVQVAMTNFQAGRPVFTADFSATRQLIEPRALTAALWRHPIQPLRMHLAIYLHAAVLFLKRVPFFTHPKKRAVTSGSQSK